MNGIHIINSIMEVNRTMQEDVSNARFNNVLGCNMVPHTDQFSLGYFSHTMLTGCKEQVTQAEKHCRTRSPIRRRHTPNIIRIRRGRLKNGSMMETRFQETFSNEKGHKNEFHSWCKHPVIRGYYNPESRLSMFPEKEAGAGKETRSTVPRLMHPADKSQSVRKVAMIIQIQKRISRGTNKGI